VKAVRIVVWLAGAALCSALVLGAERGLWPPADKARIAYGTAFFGITIGVVVWQLRPDSRTGILLTAWPFTAVFADLHFVFLGSALAVTVGYAAYLLYAPVFAHLVLSYPTGRLRTRLDRTLVVSSFHHNSLPIVRSENSKKTPAAVSSRPEWRRGLR